MKKSQLREYIQNYINEIRLKSGDKGGNALKAFRDPDGIIYLIFKGISRFSVLHSYTVKIGREDAKTGQIKFELEGYDITNFKSALDILNIPYTSTTEGMYYKVGIDKEYIDIKNMSRYMLTDEDVKKDNWYTDITISEVRLKSGDKTGSLKVYKVGSKYILYILQKNGEIYFTVGYDLSGNVIRFDEEDDSNNIKKILTANNIKYKEGSRGFGYYIDVDMNDINVIEKPADTTIYQVNPKEDGWYHDLSINEVRFTSSKSDKLKAFKDREGGVTLYYNQPGADWFSQVIKSDYGTLDRSTNLVNFYFWSDEKMTEFEGILDHNGIAYTKPTIDDESDIISIDKGRFDFIDIPTGSHMKAVEDNEWYNPLP